MLRRIFPGRSLSRRRRTLENTATEQLESRTLLTGTVKVAWVAGDIVIKGDAKDNAILIDLSQDEPQDIFTGLDGTRIRFDGQLRRADDLSDLRRLDDIRFDMRLGDDTVIVLSDDFVTPDDVKVDLGFGEDTFVMIGDEQDPTFVNGDLSIRSRGKETTIGLANVEIRDDLKIKTGREQDAIVLSDVEVGDNTTVATRRSSDIIVAIDSVFGSTTRVRMGSGSDVLMAINSEVDGTLYARGSSGRDTALVDGDSTTDRIRRSGIDRLATNLNQLPDSLISSIEGRLDELSDQADDLLPRRLSNVITNEIDDLRNELNNGMNPPPEARFFSDGQTIDESTFPDGDFTGSETPKTFIGTAASDFTGTITVIGNGSSGDSEVDVVRFDTEAAMTLTFPQFNHSTVSVTDSNGQLLSIDRFGEDHLRVELPAAGEYTLSLGVPIVQSAYERTFTFTPAGMTPDPPEPPTAGFFSDGQVIDESTFPNGDFTAANEALLTFIGTAASDFSGTITILGSGGLGSEDVDVVEFATEGPMTLTFPQLNHSAVAVNGSNGQPLSIQRVGNDQLRIELPSAGRYTLSMGVPIVQSGYERLLTFAPVT